MRTRKPDDASRSNCHDVSARVCYHRGGVPFVRSRPRALTRSVMSNVAGHNASVMEGTRDELWVSGNLNFGVQ